MNSKLLVLSLFLMLLFVPSISADIGDIADFFSTGGRLAQIAIDNPEFSSLLLLFAIFLALYILSINKLKTVLGWGTESNAPTALAIAFAVASTLLSWFALDQGRDLFTVGVGKLILLVPLFAFLMLIGYIAYKKREDSKGLHFLIIAIIIIAIYYIIDTLLPDFTDEIGGLGTLVEIVVVVAWITIVIGGMIVLWNTLLAPLFGLKAQKPLSQQEFGETKEAIKQKREIESEKAASKQRKEERTVRRSLRKISRQVKEAASILSSLHQAAAQKKPDLIKGKNWKKWQGELKKLEILKIRTSEYAALISKVLAETISLPGGSINPNEKRELELYKNALLANSKDLERYIAGITASIQQIDNSTPPGDPLWSALINLVKNASDTFTKIETDGQAGLALEQKVREDLGRS